MPGGALKGSTIAVGPFFKVLGFLGRLALFPQLAVSQGVAATSRSASGENCHWNGRNTPRPDGQATAVRLRSPSRGWASFLRYVSRRFAAIIWFVRSATPCRISRRLSSSSLYVS
jgi:hypothetical protein